jgi:hypothetical protein
MTFTFSPHPQGRGYLSPPGGGDLKLDPLPAPEHRYFYNGLSAIPLIRHQFYSPLKFGVLPGLNKHAIACQSNDA